LGVRDNLEGLNDSLRGKTSPPYIYEGTRPIEGIPIIKNIKTIYFLCPNPNSLFPNPNFSVALGGGFSTTTENIFGIAGKPSLVSARQTDTI
jgi:hypothetical protein